MVGSFAIEELHFWEAYFEPFVSSTTELLLDLQSIRREPTEVWFGFRARGQEFLEERQVIDLNLRDPLPL